MNFSEAKSHAMGVLFDTNYFSKLVTYTPHGGAPIPNLPANFSQGSVKDNDGRRGDGTTWRLTVESDSRADFRHGVARHVATVVIRASDVPSPGYRDTMVFEDGSVWRVTEVYDA